MKYKKLDIAYNKDISSVEVVELNKIYENGDGTYKKEAINIDQNVSHSQMRPGPEYERTPFAALYMDTLTIRMPVEKPGDIFEYKIVVRNKPFIKDNFWSVLVFNDTAPIKKSVFVVDVPETTPVYYKNYNLSVTPTIIGKDGRKVYRWEADDLPGLQPGMGSSIVPDMLSRVVVSSTNQWDDVIAWFESIYNDKIIMDGDLMEETNNIVRKTPYSEQQIPDSIRKMVPSLSGYQKQVASDEIIRILFDFIAFTMPYLGDEMGKGAFVPRRSDDVLRARQGDCKGKVVLLTAMLRSQGLEAYPALVNIGSDIPLTEQLPMPYYFNHALVYVPAQKDLNKDLWVDPTLYNARWNYTPPQDRGRQALVIYPAGGSKFIEIPPIR